MIFAVRVHCGAFPEKPVPHDVPRCFEGDFILGSASNRCFQPQESVREFGFCREICQVRLWLEILVVFGLVVALGVNSGLAQVVMIPRLDPFSDFSLQYEIASGPQLELVDGPTRGRLKQLEDYINEKHWQEAIRLLREPIERNDRRLMPVSPSRLIPLADWCRIKLAQMPREGVAFYRAQFDKLGQKLLEEARREHRPELYRRVVEQAFGTTACAEAVVALGDLAIERGHFATARAWWQMALPMTGEEARVYGDWPALPPTGIDLAAVRARLVLASILEGDLTRASAELEAFEQLHGNTAIPFGGQNQSPAKVLRELLRQASEASSPSAGVRPLARVDCPSVGYTSERSVALAGQVFPLALAWRQTYPGERWPRQLLGVVSERSFRRGGNSARSPLSYHPCVVGGHVFVVSATEVWGWKLSSGEPAWAGGPVIYRDPVGEEPFSLQAGGVHLGVPQYTATVHGNRLFARMGSGVTIRPAETRAAPLSASALVCLDLEAQGRLVWRQLPPEPQSIFEGSPVCDGDRLFVLLRRNEIHTELWLAAYEAATGRLLWRKRMAAGEPLGRLMLSEASHILLTLAEDHLYFCTNLGAIVAASTDGEIRWVATYPRQRRVNLVDLPPHWLRQPNYVVFHRGIIYAAPADSPSLLALDAMTGQLLWYTGEETASASHVVGICDNRLIAAGGRLFWIGTSGAEMGRVLARWPDAAEAPGFGRALLVNQEILWPTADRLYVFDGLSAQPKKVVPFIPWNASGGNLTAARGHLVVAGPHECLVFRLGTVGTPPASEEMAGIPMTSPVLASAPY